MKLQRWCSFFEAAREHELDYTLNRCVARYIRNLEMHGDDESDGGHDPDAADKPKDHKDELRKLRSSLGNVGTACKVLNMSNFYNMRLLLAAASSYWADHGRLASEKVNAHNHVKFSLEMSQGRWWGPISESMS